MATLLIIVMACAGASENRQIGLSKDGVSEYAIVVASDAIAPEQTAARELQEHLQAVTGATLPIVDESQADAHPKRIVVGPNALFRAAFPDIAPDTLKYDGIALKTAGDVLYLAGDRPRGTLYAVYAFLEDVAGCRWWTASERFVPARPTLVVDAPDTVYVPKFRYREAFYRGAFDGVFASRLRCNGHFEQIAPEYGGHYSILGWCHTFYQLLPPGQYFAQHPEWYSEIDGKRVDKDAQLCLSNDAMRAELTAKALEWIRKDPSAGIISIAQNDCGGRCQCAQCAAAEQEEGSPSGPLLRFVNAVAESVEKEFPDVLVETLAYQYTRQAPKLARPRGNVIVRLCTIECSFAQPLETGSQNVDFKRDMDAWSAIAPKLYVWDYVTNFAQYLLPHPNLHVLAPNIRFFADHGTIGLFEQGDAGSSCGEFVELRAWLLAHLMWNPTRDADALIAEFLDGYYGPAAPALRRYIDTLRNAVERSDASLRCFMPDTSSWMGLDDYNAAAKCFQEAQDAVVHDPILGLRVRRARMTLDYAWLTRYHALKRVAAIQKKPFSGPPDPVVFCNEFIDTAYAFQVGQCSEGTPFKGLEPALRSRFGPEAPPPVECASLHEQDWADIQEFEFRLYKLGEETRIVDDPAASNKRAASMTTNHGEWAIQYSMSADVAALGPVKCVVMARCTVKAQEGGAFTVGIYDADAHAAVAQTTVSIPRAAPITMPSTSASIRSRHRCTSGSRHSTTRMRSRKSWSIGSIS
ncbi:MAG: DUF4838 domain-containing protein [Candidatus Hydrogenedentes bacterium]|nr:DUF4838 domain-containing protein [Candidatus Hydrogenedentota bacterium]